MTASTLSSALHGAVQRLRDRIGDPTASIALLVPASTNGVLARHTLQRGGSFIGVRALTPEQVLNGLARLPLARRGLRPPPVGWVELTLANRLPHLALPDDLGTTLTQPGWIPALAATLDRLERAGVTAEDLDRLPPSTHRAVLRATLAELAAQRSDQGHAGPAERLAAARVGLNEGERQPMNRLRGAIVLGDRVMPPDACAVLTEWLGSRAVEVLLPAPLDALPAARRGLRQAAGDAPVHVVAPGSGTAVSQVRRTLWRPPTGRPAPDDGTVTLARTPDEQRELAEAVRVVQHAIAEGTPIDRIALVVPDAAQAEVVRETLRRASLPATMLVGPPVTSGPSGSFLRLALDVAAGQDDLTTWHALLTTPALRLGRALGEGATTGRGRWRRLLSTCGTSSGAARIRQGLARLRDACDTDGSVRDPEGDRAAIATLDRALATLSVALRDLRTPRSLGGFAHACADFLHRFGARSQEGVLLQAFLKSLGTSGPSLPFRQLRAELLRVLDGTPQLEGRLSDRALVVATPMALLGGSFDLVCITGLSHGRLPRKLQADALLPDALIDKLAQAGFDLLPSTELAAREPRRLAAALGACTGTLWLSAPAFEMLEGRPTLPSALLLDVATALSGKRASFADLDTRFVRAGSRHRAFTEEPDRALNLAEHRTARAWNDPVGSLPWLLTHPAARRVIAHLLHRDDAGPSPWTGAVPPDLVEVPGLHGPTRATALQQLLSEPEAFFLRRILGVWPVRRLPGAVDVLDVNRHVSAALDRAIAEGIRSPDAVLAAWETCVREAMPLDEIDAHELDIGRELARRTLAPVLDAGLDLTEPTPLEDAPLAGWRLEGRAGFEAEDGLHVFLWGRAPSRGKALEARIGTFLHALAEGRSDGEVVRLRSLKSGEVAVPLGEVRQAATAWLHAARIVAEAGWWTDRPVVEAARALRPPEKALGGPLGLEEVTR